MTSPTYDLSVIIPTRDMSAHLPRLAAALTSSGLTRAVREIIFVDDGSRDETPAVLAAVAAANPLVTRVIRLEQNQGRYLARRRGAVEATSGHLLFLDTRVTPPDDFVARLTEGYARGSASAVIRIDTSRSVFNLYWERTHAFLFARNRRDERAGFAITPATYDAYVTGTGALLCRRDEFLHACDSFGARALLSDDTALLRTLVEFRPIFVREDLFVWWEPRQDLGSFLGRLLERGPGFVEYHVLARRGRYFWVLAASFAATALAAATQPTALALIPPLILLTTAAFARGPVEFARLAPLHLLVCFTAALAVIRGVFYHLRPGDRR